MLRRRKVQPLYATLSYDVTAGPDPIEDVRDEILKVFKNRDTCDLLSDTCSSRG